MTDHEPGPAAAPDPLAGFLTAVAQLPTYVGLTFRGADGPAPAQSTTIAAPLATSRNPRVATENTDAPGVFAIVSKTGRFIAPLSAHPDEEEVVLLPGTTLTPIARVAYPPFGEVTVLEELSTERVEGLPADLQALANAIYAALDTAAAAPPVDVHSPGKFRGR